MSPECQKRNRRQLILRTDLAVIRSHVRTCLYQLNTTSHLRTHPIFNRRLLRTQRALCRRKHPGRPTARPIESLEWCAAAAEYEAVDTAPSGNVGHRQLSVRLSRTHAHRFSGAIVVAWDVFADGDRACRKHHVWQGTLAVMSYDDQAWLTRMRHVRFPLFLQFQRSMSMFVSVICVY